MINPHQTGAYISKLRKERDWTQLELAEKLHVTHQAVSRWETGDSFPDIAVLPQIARLFGITVDDLLNGEPIHHGGRRATAGALVEEMAQGHASEAARMVRDEPEGGIEAMLDAAPLARPSVVNEVMQNLSGYNFQPHHIMQLAPFVSQDVLQSLLENAALEGVRGEMLVGLAPFIDQQSLGRMALQAGEGALELDELASIAPFLSQKTLQELVFRVADDKNVEGEILEQLAPFLSRETLDELVRRLPVGPLASEHIRSLAPFLSRETLDALIDRLADREALGEYLPEIAPFLSRETLHKIVIENKGGLSADDIVDIAPFLDKATLTEMIRRAAKG